MAVQFLVEGVQPIVHPSSIHTAISLNVVSPTGEFLCNAVTSPLEDTDVCIIMHTTLQPTLLLHVYKTLHTFWSQHICQSANASPAI